MLRTIRFKTSILLLASTLVLAACESDEEKAERFFQSALALLEAGDTDRAAIEFKNVFQHNGFHKEAREAYAALLMARGEISGAVSQYLRLVEDYPDTLNARIILSETAAFAGDWEEAERHGAAAMALAPADPRVERLGLVLDYQTAVSERDDNERAALSALARQKLDAGAGSLLLTLVAVDHLSQGETPLDALPYIEIGLEADPRQFDLHMRKLSLLTEAGEKARAGAHLEELAGLFPDHEEIQRLLLSWYMGENERKKAETYLRSLADRNGAGAAAQIALVQFLLATSGADAATKELESLLQRTESRNDRALYEQLYASVDFERGNTDAAIARLRGILADEATAPGARIDAQLLLARILDNKGSTDEAQSIVAGILSENDGNPEALKMRAKWRIDAGDTRAAIVDLRTALNTDARDPQTLTLMALAHDREGDSDLASERLALAVEVSGESAPEALRYAAFLADQGRLNVASTVLQAAARRAPGNIDVLNALAEIYLEQQDWVRAQDMSNRLRRIDSGKARQAAQFVQAAILSGQNRIEESLAFLQSQISDGTEDAEKVAASVLIVQNLIRSDRLASALDFVEQQMRSMPNSLQLRLLRGNLLALSGDLGQAEEVYRAIIADAPKADLPVRLLLTVLFAADRAEEARSLLDASLARMPQSFPLNWAKATILERDGDLAGAAAVYETLYALDTTNTLVANNLASLLVASDNAKPTVERAYTIARRLRSETPPEFQDTYGWIKHLRGETAEAIPYLESAQTGLPDHPQINYHLGAAYAAHGQTGKARAFLDRAVSLYGTAGAKPAQDARELLEQLE